MPRLKFGPKIPERRIFSRAVPFKNSFVVVGGYAIATSNPTDTIYYLNPVNMTWELLPQRLAIPRARFFAVLLDDDMVECE